MIRKSLAMAIFIGLFMGATTLHHGFGGLIAFIDMPSILLVIGCTASATLWSFKYRDILSAFKHAWSDATLSEADSLMGYNIFRKMSEYALSSGMIGTLIGLIQILQNMDDPSAIGPAMAVAILTLLYGIILGEITFKPMATEFIKQDALHLERKHQRGRIHTYAALCTVIVLYGFVLATLLYFTS